MQNHQGFTLIEAITTLVLLSLVSLGLISLFTYGVNGYIFTQRNADYALKAQIALDRISYEFKDLDEYSTITYGSGPQNATITYSNTRFNATRNLTIDLVAGTMSLNGYLLLDKIKTSSVVFQVNTFGEDVNNDGSSTNDIKNIFVSFQMTDAPVQYQATIHPRGLTTLN